MVTINDIDTAVRTYPETNMALEIVEVDFPGTELNTTDTATFRVTNTGPLVVTGVTLRVQGQNGATVANNGAAAPFVSEFVTQELPAVGAHNGSEITVRSPLKFKPPGRAQNARNLVKVTLEDWRTDFQHLFDSHTGPVTAVETTYNDDVLAS